MKPARWSREADAALLAHNWPGNVRELQNIVERALILSQGDRLMFPELNAIPKTLEIRPQVQSAANFMTMDQAVANHIRQVLEVTRGQIAGKGGAAGLLQMNESTLRFRMKKLGIQRVGINVRQR